MATLHIDKIIAEKVNQDDLIRLLETVIDEEMQRPEAEMNCDLIDQCVDALLEMRQDRDHLAVMVPLMQDKAFLHLIQRKAGNTARLNGAARGALIAAAILASTISVNAMVDAAFDYNILEHIGKAISASVLGPEIIGGEDDVDEPTTVPGATDKSEPTTVPERTTANANGETATRQPEQTTTAAAVTQPTTTTPTTTEREQESTTKKVTGDNVHHKPTQPDRPEETTNAVRVIGFNAQLGESFKSHYIYGEQLSYDGLTLTADWSDGTTKPVALKNCTYTTQVNMNRTADVTLNILYKGFLVEIPITVRPNEETRESTICQTDRYDYLLCKAGAYVTAYRGTAKELICNVVDGNRIFAIADEVFRKHTELTTVELPYVTYVGAKAFAGCTALTQAELPKLQQLGEEAFAGCKALVEAETGDSLTHIGRRAFAETALQRLRLGKGVTVIPEGLCNDCTHLESVRLQGQVTEIGKRTFGGCKSLDVELPPQLEKIGDKAFYRSGIKNAILPDTVRSIGSGAFEQTRSMVSATLPTTITAVPERMFYASYVERVSLPVSLQSIGKAAFFNCMHLTDLQLPEGLITIEGSAFSGCTVLKELTLPGSLKHVGEKVFGGSNIEIVHVEEGITELAPVMFADCPLTQVDLPNTLTTIQDAAFYNCTKLKEITLPNSVTQLGEGVFQGCSSLSQVRLSENLKTLPTSTFDGCKALTEFDFAGITEIGSEAFQNTGIQILDLPTTVKTLGESAFAHSALQEIWSLGGVETLPTDVFAYTQIQTFDIPQGLYIAPGAFEYSALQKVATGIDVTEINDGAFRNCRKLTSVELNEDVTRIGDNAFRACTALTSIDFPESLVSIGDYAFYTSGLTSLVVPNTVQQMGRMAFAGSALTEVSVVSGVKTLGDYAFAGCHATFRLPMSLTEMGKYPLGFTASESDGNVTVFKMDDVNVIAPAASESIRYAKENDLQYKMIGPEDTDFNEENYLYGTVGDGDWYFDKRTGALSTNATNVGTKQGFYFTNGQLWKYKQAGVRSVHLLNGVKNLGEIFAGITTLEQVTATDSLTNINTDAFVGCTGLKSVSLPAVTKIGANSFADCTALQTVDLPLAATISDHAFKNCTALQFLELPAVTKITSTAFAGCTGLTNLTLGKGAAEIDDRAFTDCKALTNLDLGSTVSIGREAFAGCTALAAINLPDRVTRLGVGAFRNCTGATGIEIGSGLTEVPAFAFADCTGVKDIAFDEGVVTIGPNAFQNAVSVVFLTLPNSVTTVGSHAFAGLLNVEKITLGSGLTKVESYAFDNAVNCYQLTLDSAVNALTNADMVACHLAYYGGQKPMIPGAGMAYSVEGYNSFRRIGENTAGLAVVVGDHATALSMHFLAAQTDKVKRVTLGKQVQRIGYEIKKGYTADYTNAFAAEFIGNGYLEQVTVSSENPYLYADGSGLYSKDKSTLYAAVTGKVDYTENTASAIGDWALSCNAKLKKVMLGKSVRTVGTKAFAYDQKLKYVQLTDGLQQIGASAFTGCTALKVLELPDTVTALGDNVFENCTALASVLLSDQLTALPTYAFRNCTALTGVVVPNSVATFNPGAFADCKALTEVYIGSQSTRYVQLGTNRTHVFARCPALTVYTMAGSDAAVYAKTRNIPTKLYTDADAFADLCAMKRDIYAGYLGFCTDGHGDIQWLTVYAADCTHDGYAIGVCEYCSAILEERHTAATGHNYVVSETPAADGRDGVRITTCQNCGDSSYTVLPGSGTAVEETHTVTGTVVLAADRAATKGTHAAIGADILLNGYTLATTDEKGNFSLQLKSGTYALTVRYAYGFSRTLYLVVSDRDLQCGSVPVIGCDWNKDGKIDDQDYYMFKLIFGTHQGQAGYLSYVDMNHDGMINTRDMVFVERCMGLQAGSFAYTPLVIR